MKPHLVHQLVHDERSPCHVAGVLKEGYEEIQEEDVRKEDKHAAHSPDYPVHNQVLERPVLHVGRDKVPEFLHQPFYPLHRIIPDDECAFEHEIQHQEKYRECQPFVGDHSIYLVCDRIPAPLSFERPVCLGKGTLNEGIFRIHDCGFSGDVHQFIYPLLLLESCRYDFIPVIKSLDDFLNVLVILKILDGKIAGGVFESYLLVFLNQKLDAVYALFNFCSVVDVYVTAQLRCIPLIYLDDSVEELRNAFPAAADCRDNRESEKMTEGLYVKLVLLRPELVIHVQGHDDPQVHVNQLGRKIEVALEIGCIHHIHHDIGKVFYEVAADIELLRAVGRERICPGKVDKGEFVAPVLEIALFRVDGHSAVVAHMLMAAGSDVEEGCLAAVGIADQSDPDHLAAFGRQMPHFLLDVCIFLPRLHVIAFGRLNRRKGFLCRHHLLGLGLAYHLYFLRLLAPQ